MYGKAYPVSQGMAEIVTVTAFGNDAAGSPVHCGSTDSGTDCIDGGQLSPAYQAVDLKIFGIPFTGNKGPGHVRAVAVKDQSHVDHQRLVLLNSNQTGYGMGQGTAPASGHNGLETWRFSPQPAHGGFQRKCNVDLCLPGADCFEGLLKDEFVEENRAAQLCYLFLVLYQAHCLYHSVHRQEGDPDFFGHGLHLIGHSMQGVMAFKGERGDTQVGQQFLEESEQTLGIKHDLNLSHLIFGLDLEPKISEQQGRSVCRDEQDAGTFANVMICWGIAAQVSPVMGLGNEQCIDFLSAEFCLYFLYTPGENHQENCCWRSSLR